tara:strand:+ start:21486 stop:21632 length:147 start_codon:yes stop_codon:yes gene_type:complete
MLPASATTDFHNRQLRSKYFVIDFMTLHGFPSYFTQDLADSAAPDSQA